MEEKHGLRKVGNKKHLENINLHHFGNIADRQKIQIYSAIKDALLITTDKNELCYVGKNECIHQSEC